MHRLLFLGDSYTIGEGVEPAGQFPRQLVRLLRARGMDVGDPEIIARTAWTSDELWEAICTANPAGAFDLVILLVGVNDQYRARPVQDFRPEYERLMTCCIGIAGGDQRKVLAMSIPDWGATPFAEGRDRTLIGGEIDAYNACARELAHAAGVQWLDVTSVTRLMLSDPALVAPDALHPSAEMYGRWAELLVPFAEAALSRRD